MLVVGQPLCRHSEADWLQDRAVSVPHGAVLDLGATSPIGKRRGYLLFLSPIDRRRRWGNLPLSGKDRVEINGLLYFGGLEVNRRDRRKDLLLQTQGSLVVRRRAEDIMCNSRPVISEANRTRIYHRGGAP
jgi:hypothetical protein